MTTDDRDLIDLVRRGVSGWRGPSEMASAARYARPMTPSRWRSTAALTGAFAAVVLVVIAMAGGPGPVLNTFLIAPASHSEASPSAEPSPSIEPSPTPNSEPPPPTRTEPSPAPRHEPTPSPEPAHSPRPPEPTPTPKTK